MLLVKQQLLAALAAGWKTSRPAPVRAPPLKNPKVAAHGDYACTAAMQLAKPLKLNPRALGGKPRPRWRPRPPFSSGWMPLKSLAPAF